MARVLITGAAVASGLNWRDLLASVDMTSSAGPMKSAWLPLKQSWGKCSGTLWKPLPRI